MKQYKIFNNWCFLTATPNEPEFTLYELKDIRIEVAPFELEKVHIENRQTEQVEATTKKLIEDYINNRFQNAHIFVNSTEIIASLIKACNLTNDNCKAVWGEGNKSYKRTIAGIVRSTPSSPAKKINFYTSCSFEGCNVWDEEGQYIIVSDGAKAHTQNDISTSFRQIIGRIRNTKYRATAIHIYKRTRYSNMKSYEEYKDYSDKLLKDAINVIDVYNKCEVMEISEGQLNDQYITKEDGIYTIDRNLVTSDLQKYKISMHTYSSISVLQDEQNKAGFTSSSLTAFLEPSDLLKRNKEAKISFKDSFKEYVGLKNNGFETYMNSIDVERIALIEEAYPQIRKYFDLIGVDEVETMKYNQTNLNRKLIALSDKSIENKIAKLLKESGITRNEWISTEDCKAKLQDAYILCNIEKTAKSTDINKYFVVENKSIRVEKKDKKEKELTRGYKIVMDKFVFN